MAKKVKKQLTSKTVRIACTSADLVKVDDLMAFQGGLKTLSEDNYQKLRAAILKQGVSFPISVWKSGKERLIIDGHQRVATLTRMRDQEGYSIPPVPVSWVEAATAKEAAEKVLSGASQFGEMAYQGLFDFAETYNFELPELSASFSFPEIDMDRFEKTYFPEEREVSFTVKSKPLVQQDSGPTEVVRGDSKSIECPKCGFEFE